MASAFEKAARDETLAYEHRAALLELECVRARRNVFDVEEVLEENRALREQLAALTAERRLAAATEAGGGEGVVLSTPVLCLFHASVHAEQFQIP